MGSSTHLIMTCYICVNHHHADRGPLSDHQDPDHHLCSYTETNLLDQLANHRRTPVLDRYMDPRGEDLPGPGQEVVK